MGDHEEEEVSTGVEAYIELECASKTASTLTEQELRDGSDSITQPQQLDESDKPETDSLNHSYPHSNDVDQESSSVEDRVKEASRTNGDTSDPDTIVTTIERTYDEQTLNTDNRDALQSAHLSTNSQELTKADQPTQEHETMSSSDISTGSNDHSPSHPVSLNQSDSTNPAMPSESGDESPVAVKDSTQSIEQSMDSEEVSKLIPVSDGSDRKQLPIKHDVIQGSSGDVYSTVVSPQTSHSIVSPLNTLSLEQEMGQLKEPEEMVLSQDSDENEGKSHLLKSAGVHLSSSSPEPRNGDTKTNLPLPSSESIKGKPLPVVYDRSLEQFSEILLDSDVSLSDDESQDALSENATKSKVEKRVRFADEVEDTCTSAVAKQTESSAEPGAGVSTQGGRTLPHLPNLISGSRSVQKHPGVPVSPSPTSPKNPVGQLPSPRHSPDELIEGVEYSAEYLGSTSIILSGSASNKTARMHQAQQAVKLIKDPENESQPHFSVKVKISTQGIKIADGQIDLMDHPLRTISYVADIDNVLVIMAYRAPPSTQGTGGESPGHIPKLTCHVLETADARHVALVIGQAFSVAYQEFLRANGISEEALEEAEYSHVLNAQSVPQTEVESLTDRNKTKKLTLAKHKGEMMGIMVMESGYGSAIPTCIIAHMSKNGTAMKSGLLNVGDHIISLNGVSLVGMPVKACVEQIKKCRYQNVVKMVVCSCPAAVDVTIVRPDIKFQLGFTVQDGVIVSLIRGTIAERSGIRVGHYIIEINGTSTVGMEHADVVHLLSTTVGDVHIRTMPSLMYRLITGQVTAEYS